MKKLSVALLFLLLCLTGCAKQETLDFDSVQTQTIQANNQGHYVIIPKDKVEVPEDIQKIINGPITGFEKYIGSHVKPFDSVDDISADELVLIAVFSEAGLSQRDGSLQLRYEDLNSCLCTVFGQGDYLQLRNSSFYKPSSGLFEFEQGDFTYLERRFVLVCEGYEKKGNIVKIKLSKYLYENSWMANGIFAYTRGYELKETDGVYHITRIVDYIKVDNSYEESSRSLTFEPM